MGDLSFELKVGIGNRGSEIMVGTFWHCNHRVGYDWVVVGLHLIVGIINQG